MARSTLEDDRERPAGRSANRTPGGGLERSLPERLEAWALTGPPGRAWSFAVDLACAVPILARHWAGRLRDRRRGQSSDA
ncbi:MAG TPA: hypothetical protein VE523_06665 [Solirubrobacterales bacterium]|nr:hypothetical protein [Solirubrobacterales bacterium]